MPTAPISPITANTAAAVNTAAANTALITGSSTPRVGSAAAGAASALDRDTFLKLLVAQLKYQDPSKPVDASEMISQSAQLSVVDKLDLISTSLMESGTSNRLALGGSIIGKQVSFIGPDGSTLGALVSAVTFDGTSTVLRAGSYDVPLDAVKSITSPTLTPTPTPTPATATPTTAA